MRKVLGTRLKGSEGFTRWDRRPLTAQQLEYAADDARCLLTLGERLEERLAEQGRLEWAREECRALEEVSDERPPERVYERLPRLARLGETGRAVARELVDWREEIAEAMDRPAGFVLPDQALMEVARRAPTDPNGLEQIRGLPPQTLHRRGDQLLAAIARGAEREPPPSPPTPPSRDAADAPLVSLAQALVRQRSMDSGVAVELIATQSELAALVTAARRGEDGDGLRVTDGWRRELVGDELRELLAGRRRLGVGPDRTLRVSEGEAGTETMVNRKLLGIYLNDHLAGSTVGMEVARRTARSNKGSGYGAFLEEAGQGDRAGPREPQGDHGPARVRRGHPEEARRRGRSRRWAG